MSTSYPLAEVYGYSGWTRCCYAVLDTLARNGGHVDLADPKCPLSASGKKRVVRIPGLVRRSPYGKRGVELTQDGWNLINHCRRMYDLKKDATVGPEMRAELIACWMEEYDPGMLLRCASRNPVI